MKLLSSLPIILLGTIKRWSLVTAPTISFNKNQCDISDEMSPTSNYYYYSIMKTRPTAREDKLSIYNPNCENPKQKTTIKSFDKIYFAL